MSKELPEVENIVIIGPGSILAEARIKQGLSIDEVANKLNFRATLIKDIEADTFDKSISDTFNRGYLKNYAKFVNIPISEVIELYENLNIAEENQTKMQSFSNGTTKEAQNNLLMWISYLILTIFIGVTVMWWLQDNKDTSNTSDVSVVTIEGESIIEENSLEEINTSINQAENQQNDVDNVIQEVKQAASETASTPEVSIIATQPEQVEENSTSDNINSIEPNTSEPALTTKVIFNFSGDCWINIYDVLGERIAWGVKKAGYVMTIDAHTPLKITIGRPELVNIDFGGDNIDMSVYPEGHVAKFTLPLLPES